MTIERVGALICPNCVLFANSAEIQPAMARGLVRASERVRDALVEIWGGEPELSRRETAIAQSRMFVAQGRVEPPSLQARGVAAGGGTADDGGGV